jgi:hypothetical protein
VSGDIFVQSGRFILGSGQLPCFSGQLLPQSYQPFVRRSGVRVAGGWRHRPVALPLTVSYCSLDLVVLAVVTAAGAV